MRTAKALDVPKSIATRVWLHINRKGPIHPTLGTRCEIWTGYLNPRGYGVIGISATRTELIHRVVSVLEHGPLAAGELVLHLHGCSSRACVRHTYRGTQKQNVADARAAGVHVSATRNPKAARGSKHWFNRSPVIRNAKGQNVPKKEATKVIRAAVFARAMGRCECCGQSLGEAGQLDHAFGRAKVPQSIENCWALRLQCHDDKTNNRPKAATWITKFITHCDRYGFAREKDRAAMKLEILQVKGLA